MRQSKWQPFSHHPTVGSRFLKTPVCDHPDKSPVCNRPARPGADDTVVVSGCSVVAQARGCLAGRPQGGRPEELLTPSRRAAAVGCLARRPQGGRPEELLTPSRRAAGRLPVVGCLPGRLRAVGCLAGWLRAVGSRVGRRSAVGCLARRLQGGRPEELLTPSRRAAGRLPVVGCLAGRPRAVGCLAGWLRAVGCRPGRRSAVGCLARRSQAGRPEELLAPSRRVAGRFPVVGHLSGRSRGGLPGQAARWVAWPSASNGVGPRSW